MGATSIGGTGNGRVPKGTEFPGPLHSACGCRGAPAKCGGFSCAFSDGFYRDCNCKIPHKRGCVVNYKTGGQSNITVGGQINIKTCS